VVKVTTKASGKEAEVGDFMTKFKAEVKFYCSGQFMIITPNAFSKKLNLSLAMGFGTDQLVVIQYQ